MGESIVKLFHLLAAVVWIGGAVFIKAILEPAMKQINPEEASRLKAIITKRFNLVSWPSLAVLLVTGYLQTPAGMMFDTTSQMGMVLTLKHSLIILVIIVGMTIGMVAVPRMRRSMPSPGIAPSEEFRKASQLMHGLTWMSTLIALAIVAVAAFLW
jgi:uncharacterized membrane protein